MRTHEHIKCRITWQPSADVRAFQANHAYKMVTRPLGLNRILMEVES